jgi:hypothetical protein
MAVLVAMVVNERGEREMKRRQRKLTVLPAAPKGERLVKNATV